MSVSVFDSFYTFCTLYAINPLPLVAVRDIRRIGEIILHHRSSVRRIVSTVPAASLANVGAMDSGPERDHILVE